MQSLSSPLSKLLAEGQWFCRAHELVLLWVRCSGDLRKPALALLPGLEFHHDNRSAWLVVEDAWLRADEGWGVRATRLARDWQARREAFAADGMPMPEPAPVSSASEPGWPSFVTTAAAVCASVSAPLEGYVLVLAPTQLEDPLAFERQLTTLLSTPQLARLRWVVVTGLDQPAPAALLRALGPRASICECRVDDAQQAKDLRAMLDPRRPHGVGAGAAPLNVTPPVRIDARPALAPEAHAALMREAGLNPAYLAAAPLIQADVLLAALALKEGRGAEAIERQVAARDRCATIGEPLLLVICQITLASYLSGLGERPRAIAELEHATELADQHALGLQRSQALLALGLIHALDRRTPEAVDAYARAGQSAEQHGDVSLAIEAWRLAGQLLLERGHGAEAMAHLHRAIEIGSGAPPAEVARSSASEAARQLAAIHQQRGQMAQAISLYEQADRFDAGEPAQERSDDVGE